MSDPFTAAARPDALALEEARQHHIGRSLVQAARAFNSRALSKLQALGHGDLGMAHLNLLPHLDVHGTRIVTLAERAGMTKQAAGQLVGELERWGYVERRPDPQDGRAQRIVFTESGWTYLQQAQRIKREIEAEYRTALGEEHWQALQVGLQQLLAFETAGEVQEADELR
ncbi:MarR family transcriptional regulator [Deinococcus sp. KNUC1210]|uniref:MarR family winged helix-turn-helix transcriptional regulator n=1 Tax=Deinococcus sp. KNUC1210 TaxID=2917691 RepID=UPI001EF0AFB4|nr:MarR family transcriptional regulator [Deinococcus sp. KNUC1210]ULH16590.1 MarR family transcriptional regulator [Deinococcus sp. KNUC1210]